MIKFIGGVVVGAVIGLMVGAFHPSETKAQAANLTNTVGSAVAKGASTAQQYADKQLQAPSK